MGSTIPGTGGLGSIRKLAEPEPVSNSARSDGECDLEVQPDKPFPALSYLQSECFITVTETKLECKSQGLRNKNLIL